MKNIIDVDRDLNDHALDQEKLQFGMALRQLGALDFAQKIFSGIDSTNVPDVLLYKSISRFNQWDYEATLNDLIAYTESPKITEQQKMIGLVNLAAALAHTEKYDQALDIIQKAFRLAAKFNHQLIKANLMELWAQILVSSNHFEEASSKLQEATLLINDNQSIYKLFVEKWRAILSLKQTNCSKESLQALNAVRDKALQLKHWESIRDCDFYFATHKKDPYLFLRLFFGTPYSKYRHRLMVKMNQPTIVPKSFVWSGSFRFSPEDVDEKMQIDLTQNDIKIGSQEFDQFHLHILILKGLRCDFYAPVKPVSLYLRILKNENLMPEEAIQRVFNAVSKLNTVLKKENIPLEVVSSDEGYRLTFKERYFLKIPIELQFQDRQEFFQSHLKKPFSEQIFSSSDVCDVLQLSKRTTIRYLKDAVESGTLASEGAGSKIRYRFAK